MLSEAKHPSPHQARTLRSAQGDQRLVELAPSDALECFPNPELIFFELQVQTVPADFRLVFTADLRILILIFDLVDRALSPPLCLLLRVSSGNVLRIAAQPEREIAGGRCAAVEVLVVHALGGRQDGAVLPVDAFALLVPLEPEE